MSTAEKTLLDSSDYTSEVYDLDGLRVLKLFREGRSRDLVEQEFANLRAVNHCTIPTPKAYELMECDGRYGFTMEKIRPVTLQRVMEQNPLTLFWVAEKMAKLHVQMHNSSISQIPEGVLPDQLEFFEKVILGSHLFSSMEVIRLTSLLRILSEHTRKTICHGDFHSRNILKDGHHYYIIDWPLATLGDPCVDVAATYLALNVIGAKEQKNPARELYVKMLAKCYLKEHLYLTGQKRDEIFRWMPVCAALFMVKLEGVCSDAIAPALKDIVDKKLYCNSNTPGCSPHCICQAKVDT